MPCSKMVENDTAAVGSTGKYVSEHAFGMIDMHLPNIAHWYSTFGIDNLISLEHVKMEVFIS